MATDPRPALFACLLAVSIGGAVAPPAGAQSVPRSDVRVHRVVDAVSGDAIADAEVALSRSGFTIRSDSAGEFVLVLGAEDRDTLVIRKPGYLRSALLIDGGPTSPDALTVQLNPVRPSDQEADPGGVFREIAETLNLTAGSIWHADDFWPYLGVVRHPLDLLLFSGLVHAVRDANDQLCVAFAGGQGCALVLVSGSERGDVELANRFPAEVEAFVTVGPDTAVRAMGLDGASGVGAVIVFFRSEGG